MADIKAGYGSEKDTLPPALSGLRTVVLVLSLVALIFIVVVAVVTVTGFSGAALVDAGLLALDELTSPRSVVTVILAGSALVAVVIAVGINRTLVAPLRRMTAAVEELARGNYDIRVEPHGALRLREIDEFARSFNTAAAELGSTELMREGFISDFSHEFRTPINSLCGFAQLLREDDLGPEERREYLDIIVEESQRLAGLSERILALSRIEHVEILTDVEPVALDEQLRRAVVMLEPKWSAKGVSVDVNADPCAVEGNADYLMQLWTNLIDNAVKFSPEGGSVSVALYGGRQGEEGRAADEVTCWVSDEGCGMDETTLAHLFDRFYQGDTSHASEGSGLGLALVKRIVELHHGSVDVQSTPGQGSVFEVRLPVRRA